MVATTLDTPKTWKGVLKCIKKDVELGTQKCMNLKNWCMLKSLRAAAEL